LSYNQWGVAEKNKGNTTSISTFNEEKARLKDTSK